MKHDWIATAVQASGRSHFGSDFGGFFHSLTHRFSAIAKGVGKGVGSVGGALVKVPVVGKGLHAIYNSGIAGPIQLASNVASGQRIDRAAMGSLKASVKDARDIAPYAQSIIAVVPGVGTGISGAIGAASALADGKNINAALIEGVKGALPGGAIAQAAFSVAMAGVQGKPISDIALAALPLPDDQKRAVVASVHAARDIAHGKRIDHSLYDAGKSYLPPAAQAAMQTAIALGHAKNLQDLARRGAGAALSALTPIGQAKALSDEVSKVGLAQLKTLDQKTGFTAGIGLMTHQINREEFNTIRSRLQPDQRKGFDLAIAQHIGSLTHPLPVSIPPAQRFGYYVTQGMRGAKHSNQKTIRTMLLDSHETAQGMLLAKQSLGFWPRVKAYITSHAHHNRGIA